MTAQLTAAVDRGPSGSGVPEGTGGAQGQAPHAPGTELAPGYRIIDHLNRGNRLDVYDAWSEERSSRCVLKTLRPDRATDVRARRALLQEGRLLVRSTHPHLVRAYGMTRTLDGNRPVLVLETLGGETLSHLVHRLDEGGRRLALADMAMLGIQLSSALSYLHRQRWLHLDLKPANIVADGGRARLIDLSVARRPGRARAGIGTVEYMSPEQAAGGLLTAAADVWGLGAVLHTALTGEPPYGYGDDSQAGDGPQDGDGAEASDATGTWTDPSLDVSNAYPQLTAAPSPIRLRRRLPRELAGIVDACLRHDPADRPALAEVSATLQAWLDSRRDARQRP